MQIPQIFIEYHHWKLSKVIEKTTLLKKIKEKAQLNSQETRRGVHAAITAEDSR